MTRTFIIYKTTGDRKPVELSEIELEALKRQRLDNNTEVFGFQIDGPILTGVIVGFPNEKIRIHTAEKEERFSVKTHDEVYISINKEWTHTQTKDSDVNQLLGLMHMSMAPA